MKCPICKGKLEVVNDIVSDIHNYQFVVSGDRCLKCGEEFIGEEEGNKMIKAARKLGVWGEPLKLHRKLSQSGRGTILRIPADIEKSMKLKGNEEVLISRIGKRKILVEL